MNKKQMTLIILIIFPLALLYLFSDSIAQNQNYHHFADTDKIWGINNFHNVISNLGFTLVAIYGLVQLIAQTDVAISWILFIISVFFVAPGSAYYHYNPNDQTLLWDRLPMTIGFISLSCYVLKDVFHVKKESSLLIPGMALGLLSLYIWTNFQDLRAYYWVQLSPIVIILFATKFFPSPLLPPRHIISAVGLYILAKLTERFDVQIDSYLHYSGHSVKHVLAALAVFALILTRSKYNKDLTKA